MTGQMDLFGEGEAERRDDPHPTGAALPPGFRYAADVITHDEEARLVEAFGALPFREFEFHGFTGKRRTVSFGWRYDFDVQALEGATPIPDFLLPLRERAASFAGLQATRLPHALVTEYSAGAAIGWHRDKGVFDEVIGISLLAPCTFRLRRAVGDGWERVKLVAEPRSAYLLSGEARELWEHSIPPVDALRYSVTFRSLRAR